MNCTAKYIYLILICHIPNIGNTQISAINQENDYWQEDYGVWEFSLRRFKDPKGMIKKLHALGFKVMVWIFPFVSPDSEIYRILAEKKLLILDKDETQEVLWAMPIHVLI